MNEDAAHDPPSVGSASTGAADQPLAGEGRSEAERFSPRFNRPSTLNCPPPPKIPDHELLKQIGAGSYGEVWLARNVMGAFRAVKVVYRASFEQDKPYEREFAGIQKFEPISRDYEGHVDILHAGRNDQAGYFYYVMELADDTGSVISNQCSVSSRSVTSQPAGGAARTEPLITESLITDYSPRTLKCELQLRGPLPIEQCVSIGLALTRALAHLHEHKLVHRDIKPSNIIFVNGAPKLADIGLVTGIDATRSFVGTDGYIPPEGPGTPQADLYSLGKVLYEMSTGKDRQDFPELPAAWRASEARERLLEFNEVVLKACDSDVRQRYMSAQQLEADLARLQRGESVKHRRMREQQLSIVKQILVAVAMLTLLAVGAGTLSRKLGQRDASIPSPASLRQLVENPEATKLCKLARFHYYKITEEGFAKAMECFNRALEIDPKCVSGYAGIADLCVASQPSKFLPPKAAEAKMRWARDKLMAIDRRLAEGHAVQGFIDLVYDWKPSEAERELRLALELDPELLIAHIWWARLLVYTRKFDEAEQEYKKAQQLDPIRYGLNVNVGLAPFFARRYDQAIQYFEKAIELLPNQDWAIQMIGRANEEKGDYPAAIEAFQKADLAQGGKPEVVKRKYDDLREAYENSGQDGYWRKKLVFAQSEYGRWIAWVEAREIAELYARLGEADTAFEWLDKAFQEKSDYLLWLNVDPGWDKIRSDPRFTALLKKMRLAK